MVFSLDDLPEEILYSILCYCHPTSLAALEHTARRFRNVTNEPLLWRFHCQAHFTYWDNKHNLQEKLACPATSVNWKALYISRHLIDGATSHLLDRIIASQTGRIKKFQTIIDFGYDIKDTLLRHCSVGLGTDDYLARRFAISMNEYPTKAGFLFFFNLLDGNRYYAQALLGYLHRSIAVAEWAKLRNGEPVPLERALGAFDLFIPDREHGGLDEVGEIVVNIRIYSNNGTDKRDIKWSLCPFYYRLPRYMPVNPP